MSHRSIDVEAYTKTVHSHIDIECTDQKRNPFTRGAVVALDDAQGLFMYCAPGNGINIKYVHMGVELYDA